MEFKVYFPPTSLKRHRHSKFGTHTYDPSSKDKKEFVKKIANLLPKKPLEGPLKVKLYFYEKRPKCHYRSGKYSNLLKESSPKYNTSKRDLDNFIKFILDALNKLLYLDDSQVIEIEAGKYYSEENNGYIKGEFILVVDNNTENILVDNTDNILVENILVDNTPCSVTFTGCPLCGSSSEAYTIGVSALLPESCTPNVAIAPSCEILVDDNTENILVENILVDNNILVDDNTKNILVDNIENIEGEFILVDNNNTK
jgi:Holliday junction resolvase RusA-like endonuclease